MRKKRSFKVKDFLSFKKALLYWAQQFEHAIFLDGNGHEEAYTSYDVLLATNAVKNLKVNNLNGFEKLNALQSNLNDWLFGYLSYDLKNELEDLKSENSDGLDFPNLYFFQPRKLVLMRNGTVEFAYLEDVAHEIEDDFDALTDLQRKQEQRSDSEKNIKIKLRIHKDAYFDKIETLLKHIHRGDIYEANFCQEFYAENACIDPLSTYLNLNTISEPPFAAFLKLEDKYLLSASPERYLKKIDTKVISQPIKGTAPRSVDKKEDDYFKAFLTSDEKERAENIMITDLVRNDLSKFAKKGSVEVEELCGVYAFKQVHQMISTIIAEVSEGRNPVEIIKNTFPMGSMTGAPKVSAMKIIEDLEATKRGLYSGAVGYFDPEGNFDFNVVIRSILYNAKKKYVSYSVGSAITAKSDPQKEYEECLLKAKAMRQVLESH